ncbi:MAG: asparaginase [Candidatus Tectomicrobia bacterium]|nr:asparaginase [Candidatus Tectomicrobia bacterium]
MPLQPATTQTKPRVAVIGTGGTISSVGKGPLDILDYGANETMLHVDEIIDRFPEVHDVAEVIPVRFEAVPSTQVFFPIWKDLVERIETLAAEEENLAGIVITHGTATMEETAYFLNLTLHVDLPVVLVGSQRPASALSTDAGMNLVNAVRTAASANSRGLGVLVVLNDEIQAAREVTKTSTYRLQTFRSPDFGVLGHADGDAITYYRQPVRRRMPDTEFDIRSLETLPRVDIAYTYTGSDGAAVRAFIEAGAEGIVSAGFAPGFCGPGDLEPLQEAVAQGIIVVQSTRAGSGRTFKSTRIRNSGFLIADNLNPQKARLLLALALTVTREPEEVARIFAAY